MLQLVWRYRVVAMLLVFIFSLCVSMFPLCHDVEAQRRTLYWGSRGNDVKTVQWRLYTWGYYRGRIDGVYGNRTRMAVISFQQRTGLIADGVVGGRTWAALGFRRTVGRTQGVAQAAVGQRRTLYWGSRGNDVKTVQWRLNRWGYYRGRVDGVYGNGTRRAVIRFQRRHGIPADGVVGRRTWAALGLARNIPVGRGRNVIRVSRSVSNRDNVNLLARVIMGEAADEPFTGMVAVGAVILNRVQSPSFPNSLAGVIFQPHAFESVSNGQYNRPLSNEAIRAASMALNGWDPSGGAIYFWNPAKPVNRWIWTRQIIARIGKHVFAR